MNFNLSKAGPQPSPDLESALQDPEMAEALRALQGQGDAVPVTTVSVSTVEGSARSQGTAKSARPPANESARQRTSPPAATAQPPSPALGQEHDTTIRISPDYLVFLIAGLANVLTHIVAAQLALPLVALSSLGVGGAVSAAVGVVAKRTRAAVGRDRLYQTAIAVAVATIAVFVLAEGLRMTRNARQVEPTAEQGTPQ